MAKSSSKNKNLPETAATSPSFEQALERLESIVQQLEEGDLGLAEALDQYEHGIKLLKRCYGLLERAERRIELLAAVDEDGQPVTEPFTDPGDGSLESKAQARARRRSSPAAPRSPLDHPTLDNEVDEPPGLF